MLNQTILFYKKNKATLIVYSILICFVILSMSIELYKRNFHHVFLCIFVLILFTIPYLIYKFFSIKLPHVLEISILLFIFSTQILGELYNFYGIFKYWDTILHIINGFLSAAIGFSLVDILNNGKKVHLQLSHAFVIFVAFCFSMTIGVLWEFSEFGMDSFFRTDKQADTLVTSISSIALNRHNNDVPIKINNIDETVIYGTDKNGDLYPTIIKGGYLDIGLIDTMKDLLNDFIGTITFCIIGVLYINGKDYYGIANNFIPYLDKK